MWCIYYFCAKIFLKKLFEKNDGVRFIRRIFTQFSSLGISKVSGLQRVSALKCLHYREDLIKDSMNIRQGNGLLSFYRGVRLIAYPF